MVSELGFAAILIAFSLGAFLAGYYIGKYRALIGMVGGLMKSAQVILKQQKEPK